MSEWHYTVGGERQGPVSSTQLRDLVRSGKVLRDTLVWKTGMAEWMPASRLKGLFDGVPTSSPPAPLGLEEPSLPRPSVAVPAQAPAGMPGQGRSRPSSDYGVLRFVGATVSNIGWSVLWLAIFLSMCLTFFSMLPRSAAGEPAALGLVVVLAAIVATAGRIGLPMLAARSIRWFGVALQASVGIGFLAIVLKMALASGGPVLMRLEATLAAAGAGVTPVVVGVIGILVIGVGEFLQASADVASNSWHS